MKPLPLPTSDPVTGGPLVVTRLHNPETGMTLEGVFELGWMGRLTRSQLDFVGVLLKHRANVQRLAAEVGISYNTARGRLDDIVRALDGSAADGPTEADEVLDKLAQGELSPDEAIKRLKR